MRKLQVLVALAISVGVVLFTAAAAAAAPPGARNDYVKTAVNKKVTFRVLANDSPAPGDKIDTTTLNINTFPTYGDLDLDLDGRFTYTPPPGYSGPDSFEYVVCSASNTNQCDTATVFVTVGTAATTTTAPPTTAAPVPPPSSGAQAADANALPRTGSSSTALLLAGIGLCALGAAVVGGTRLRGQRATR